MNKNSKDKTKKNIDKKTIAFKLFGSFIAGIAIGILFFIAFALGTTMGVIEICNDAERQYSGDCVEASMQLLEDEGRSIREKNNAIWVLGQLGDSRALPVLEQYYTGNIPEKESLDEVIGQYELKKAIGLARGGRNITAPIRKLFY